MLRSQGPDAAGLSGNHGGRPRVALAERKSEAGASPGPGSRAAAWRLLPAPPGPVTLYVLRNWQLPFIYPSVHPSIHSANKYLLTLPCTHCSMW